MPVHWGTLLLTIWAVAGPLVGILFGHYLITSWQRRQWLADNRLQEWRELIAAIMTAFTAIAKISQLSPDGEVLRRLQEDGSRAIEVIGNRVFIHEDVERLKVLEQWNDATHTFFNDRDAKKFAERFHEVMLAIKNTAASDIGNLKGWR